MRICPSCKTRYSDDTLVYCLQDGTPLAHSIEIETPTVVLGETETYAAGRAGQMGRTGFDPYSASAQQSQITHVASPQRQGSNTFIAVILTAAGMLLLFLVLGFAALIYFRSPLPPPLANANTANGLDVPASNSLPTSTTSTPLATSAKTPTSKMTPADTSQTVDDSQVRREVSQRIYSWKSQAEALDLNSYMGHYAGTIDYYRRAGASAAFVRADKQRAFSRYSSIRVNVSNVTVTSDPSGQTATAVFDKEWDFQGNGSSSGKVRQLMKFSKINGQWMITAEKDLKVYYAQ